MKTCVGETCGLSRRVFYGLLRRKAVNFGAKLLTCAQRSKPFPAIFYFCAQTLWKTVWNFHFPVFDALRASGWQRLMFELVRFARRRRLTDHRVFPIFSEVFPIFSKVFPIFSEVFPIFSKVFAVLLGFQALAIVGRWRGSVTCVTLCPFLRVLVHDFGFQELLFGLWHKD